MNFHRRTLLKAAMAGTIASSLPTPPQAAETTTPVDARAGVIRALAFDAFPVFDPRPIQAMTESVLPGQGTALMNAWRARQFEYQWLRALGGQYVDFQQATRDSLVFAARQLKLQMSSSQQDQLMAPWSNLQPWPDAAAAIRALRARGLRLAFLSNMTAPMLDQGIRNAGLDGQFEAVVSTDRNRTFKPDAKAYQLGVDVLALRKEEILFVAFAGWDVAGAKWFGYPTFWMNRQQAPREELGVAADGEGRDFSALQDFLRSARG